MGALVEQHQRWLQVRGRLDPSAPPSWRLILKHSRELRVKAHFAFQDVPEVFRPRWKVIAEEVARKHGLTLHDLLSERRERRLVVARQEAIWRCKMETTMSLPAIGKRFNRDHTTALHSIRKHEQRLRESASDSPTIAA